VAVCEFEGGAIGQLHFGWSITAVWRPIVGLHSHTSAA
jgi:hypothetical protein